MSNVDKRLVEHEVRDIKDIKELVYGSAELFKEKDAYLVKNAQNEYEGISFAQVKEDMNSLGSSLINLGLKGEKIAIIGENRYDWAISYLSVINGVGIVVPLDKQLPQNEIENCLTRGEVSAVIYSERLEEEIKSIAEKMEGIKYFIGMDIKEDDGKFKSLSSLISRGKALLEEGNSEYIDIEIDREAVAEILFTSGTTAKSKAVMLSHKNICFNIVNQCAMLYIDDKDIFLSLLPIHHVYECVCGFLTPLYRGCTVAYCEGLKYIQKNMKEAKCTMVLGVPLVFETIYRRIWQGIEKQGKTKLVKNMIKLTNGLKKIGIDVKKKVFKSIYDEFGGNTRLFIAGAAAINPEVSKGFRDFGITTLQGYGLSECAPIVALNRTYWYKDAAAGQPLRNTELKIDNPNEEGIGEIIVKGDHVMIGYYKDEKATNDVIVDGWFHTGDLGFLDEDNFVHITGRKKNVIITKNGKNVYPEEIEALINDIPYVKECMVYGKQDGRDKKDITISAEIIADMDNIKEKFPGKEKTIEEIKDIIWQEIKKINEGLVIYKHVTDISIREKDFEKTTTMKIKRYMEHPNT